MRKYLKEKLMTLFSEMKEAEKTLLRLIKSEDNFNLQYLLTELQQAALAIGKEAEKSEGDDSTFIHLLEEYCELIWQCNISKTCSEKLKILAQISDKRKDATSILKHYIQTQYEIVFLPYKASMWDSLESVWRAAKEDINCDCYVIPIPYYDKRPDGSLGDMHYEGHQLPEYVSVTDYKHYDFRTNHPDVIYFHNPYDQYNYVTSVHPDYYSNRLKEYTDMLVYIPYFVSSDNVPEHFCSTMGVFRADRVIVESEKIRQTYMNVYMNILGEEQKKSDIVNGYVNKKYWNNLKQIAETKFLNLGNPKYDKVILAQDAVIPKEWEELIIKTDGSKKKVIFYNTTVDAILKSREKALLKIKNTLDFFREQMDVVLLWRPHPLVRATISSVIPQLSDEYDDLVEKYQSEGWGIFDDTTDFNRAIIISDAYYGDKSSVVALYELTGKPVLIQSLDIIT
ncbi:hypothetical protein acsn021_05190 [Anaerocolumna cellulosilytica]|uniref:Uncharacterized protein n=1 Tax=Anaerocolumna cellulosilytica TaxID=433286 RepID=A0A6S6R0X5_9FIRM|nr:hypothetical protein [Anaerocolumna cellulosilytica]MBB5195714.1 hypothetical protein [Anaerocolumna cellulosilytica]BCJ92950.1 hypothetical protein acsn021_05190 [Anaerocolumna cellulosilytica]